MSVLVEFSMSPLDKGQSVSKYVSRSLDIISSSGLPYRLGPMGTCLEGEWDEVMAVIKLCYERMSQDCDRVTCSISQAPSSCCRAVGAAKRCNCGSSIAMARFTSSIRRHSRRHH